MSRKMTITYITPKSLAKVSAVIGGIAGLAIGCVISMFSLMSDNSMVVLDSTTTLLFSRSAVLTFPVVYIVLAGGLAYLSASLYNATVHMHGGFNFNMDWMQEEGAVKLAEEKNTRNTKKN